MHPSCSLPFILQLLHVQCVFGITTPKPDTSPNSLCTTKDPETSPAQPSKVPTLASNGITIGCVSLIALPLALTYVHNKARANAQTVFAPTEKEIRYKKTKKLKAFGKEWKRVLLPFARDRVMQLKPEYFVAVAASDKEQIERIRVRDVVLGSWVRGIETNGNMEHVTPQEILRMLELLGTSFCELRTDSKVMLQTCAEPRIGTLDRLVLKENYDPVIHANIRLPRASSYQFDKVMDREWASEELRFTVAPVLKVDRTDRPIVLFYEIKRHDLPTSTNIPYYLIEAQSESHSEITITHVAPPRIEDVAAKCTKKLFGWGSVWVMRVHCKRREKTREEMDEIRRKAGSNS